MSEWYSDSERAVQLVPQLKDQLAVKDEMLVELQSNNTYLNDRVLYLQRRVNELQRLGAEADACMTDLNASIVVWRRAHAEAEARTAAAERELERWRHGVTIEGDFVCPDSLRAEAAEARVKELEDKFHQYEGKPCPLTKVMAEGHKRIAALEAENARLEEQLASESLSYDINTEALNREMNKTAALEAQLNGMREALGEASAAMRNVPIVVWPKRISTRSGVWLCNGCEAKDEQDCRPGCWVARLEKAMEGVDEALSAHSQEDHTNGCTERCGAALSSSAKPEPAAKDFLEEVIEKSGPGFAEKVEAARERRKYYVDSPASVREDASDAPLSDAHSCRPPWSKP